MTDGVRDSTMAPRQATGGPATTHSPREAAAAAAVAILALAAGVWLTLRFTDLVDWNTEARPSVRALLGGHVGDFLRSAPPYGGSLLLRAPFMELAARLGGGTAAVYRAGALPCLIAAVALGWWLSGEVGRRGGGPMARAATFVACVANPIAVDTIQQAHPEELLGAVLCVAAVLCAQRDRAIWSGVLAGLAIANKPWGILAAGPVLIALPRGRVRALAAMVTTAGALVAPMVLARTGAGLAGGTSVVALQTGQIFDPWQLWWFLGSAAADGGRVPPGWLDGLGHTLPIAIMVPLTLAHRLRARRRRDGALLLLALLLLLRCALDPWDTVYYPLPFLTALLAWEAGAGRVPLVSIAAAVTTSFLFSGAGQELGATQSALAAAFAAVVTPAIGVLGMRLFGAPAAVVRPGQCEPATIGTRP